MKTLGPRNILLRRKRNTSGNYAFIDSQNLNLGIQKVGWKLDWRKFRQFLSDNYGVSKAYMFIGYMQENEALYEQMHDLGYAVVLKPTVESYKDEMGETALNEENKKQVVKGNIDADLVLYAMKEAQNYNKAVVVSGDGDFYSLCEYLVGKNKLLKILTPNWQYSSLLKEFDEYIQRLDTLKPQLSYRHKKRNK